MTYQEYYDKVSNPPKREVNIISQRIDKIVELHTTFFTQKYNLKWYTGFAIDKLTLTFEEDDENIYFQTDILSEVLDSPEEEFNLYLKDTQREMQKQQIKTELNRLENMQQMIQSNLLLYKKQIDNLNQELDEVVIKKIQAELKLNKL